MRLAALHRLTPWAVGGEDAEEFRPRHIRAVLGYQARGPQPAAAIAPVAGELEDGQTGRDLAQEDDAGRHGARSVSSVGASYQGFLSRRCRARSRGHAPAHVVEPALSAAWFPPPTAAPKRPCG